MQESGLIVGLMGKAMKKIVYLVVLLTVFVLSGCGTNYDYTLYERPSVKYYGDNDGIVLIKDYTSYTEYIESITAKGAKEEFLEALCSYTENFFEEEMLIVIVHWEGSGSIDISVKDIIYDESNIEVVLKRKVPSAGTCDMKDHGIIIELPQNSNSTTVEYRAEK